MKIHCRDLEMVSSLLGDEIEHLSGKSLFLTGGTGFIGKWLLETFKYLNNSLGLGLNVSILTRNEQAFKERFPDLHGHPLFRFIVGDIRTFSFFKNQFDYCIHGATDASVALNAAQPEVMYETIIEGARRVGKFAEESGVKRLLNLSSGAAYGKQPLDLNKIAEDYSPRCFQGNDAYAAGKLNAEALLDEFGKLCVVSVRCFAFSGPYLPLDGGYAFGNFIKDVIERKQIVIKGNGLSQRSYMYAADLIVWIVRALINGRCGQIYNVGSSVSMSVSELANRIALLSGAPNQPIILGDPSIGVTRYVPDVDKAKKDLGVEEYTSLDESILRTLEFYGHIERP